MALVRDKNGKPTGAKCVTKGQEESRRKREEHIERKFETVRRNKALRAKRSPEEQIAVLDDRNGVGVGAKKERRRLSLQIDARRQREVHRPKKRKGGNKKLSQEEMGPLHDKREV
jgi:hypothetical protein